MIVPWLFYNAVVPLIPIGIVWLISWFLSNPGSPAATVFSIIKDGQVFFFCTALASAAIGDLLGKAPQSFDKTYWVMGLLFITIISAAAFAAAALGKNTVNPSRVGWSSVLAAVATIVVVLFLRYETGLL